MTLFRRTLLISTALLSLGTAALAGPVRDFESAMRAAYADYRNALFLTNANKAEEAASAIAAFEQKWSALAAKSTEAPPQYADDPAYATTLTKVTEIADAAAAQASAGKLAEAHATLEGIRDQIGRLHERNGVVAFSDRMNAYHAAMERILEKDYADFGAAKLGELREDGAVLAFLVADLGNHPPEEAASDPGFKAALQAVVSGVEALQEAARAGDPVAARKAVGSLKVPYSKLFLKFG